MEILKIKYKPLPTWKQVHKCRKRILYIQGGVGSGKTTGAFMHLYLLAIRNALKGFRRSVFYVIRASYPQLKDSTWHTFSDTFNINEKYLNKTRFEYIMNLKFHKIIWRFRALKDEKKELDKIDGYSMTGAYIDEVIHYSSPDIIHKCNMRARWPVKTVFKGKVQYAEHVVICTSNPPPSEEHWIRKLFFSEIPDKNLYQGWEQPLTENIDNLPPDYVPSLKESLPDYLVKRYVEGKAVPAPTGAEVYIKFKREKHIKEIEPIKQEPLLRGWDFGTANPACVICQIIAIDDNGKYVQDPKMIENYYLQLRIYDEICYQNLNIREFASIVKNYCQSKYGLGWNFLDFADPHGQARTESSQLTAWQQLIEQGIHPIAGATEIRERILAVQRFLDTENGLLIHPRCVKLITGFEGMYHKVKIKGVVIDKINKNEYSHPHDALQMVCTRYPMIFDQKKKNKRPIIKDLGRLRVI